MEILYLRLIFLLRFVILLVEEGLSRLMAIDHAGKVKLDCSSGLLLLGIVEMLEGPEWIQTARVNVQSLGETSKCFT